MTGRFIVLEGGEGVGKSTQVRALVERLRGLGYPVSDTREPGGTDLGRTVRSALLHTDADVDPRAELLLLMADRAQHVVEIVRPRLARGEIVVSDRFTPSSLAYQGVARGVGVDPVERMSAWAAGGLEPDVVVVLDLPDAVAEARIASERDRLEREGDSFHARVRRAYRDLAGERGWSVVDASGSEDEVAARVWTKVLPILPSP
jgi:dTMP kinase